MSPNAFPLTPMQQSMLWNHLGDPPPGTEVLQVVGVLREAVEPPRLERAFQELVRHHDAFRLRFIWDQGPEPHQEIVADVRLPFTRVDWSAVPAEQRETDFRRWLVADRERGFDLAHAPATRVALIRFAAEDHRLVWTHHHIILDGRSELVVLTELERLLRGANPEELGPAASFRDHVGWVSRQAFGDEARTFWAATLAGLEPGAGLDFARPSPGTASTGFAARHVTLDEPTTAGLREVARRADVALNTLVQGAWALALGRASGGDDVVFGMARSGRYTDVAGARTMVGNLINALPVRIVVAADQDLATWLAGIRAQNVGARLFEHVPLATVHGWSGLPADVPLYQTMLIYDDYLLQSALRRSGPEWESREFRLIDQTSLPLNLYAYGEASLRLEVTFDRSRMDEAAATALVDHVRHLLLAMAEAGPAATLGDLDHLSRTEEALVLADWNATEVDYPTDATIHGLVDEQIARSPTAPALAFADTELTFSELGARIRGIAALLRETGVRRGSRVGVFLDRSLMTVPALLGVLRAGGAYVPLDPGYPRDRIAFMIEDAALTAVITRRELASELETTTCPVILVEDAADDATLEPGDDARADDLAYVLYTSGSTGRPKGVMVTHKNVVNFFAGMDAHLPADRAGVWLAVTSISFDISVLELFWTLTRGYQCVVHADDRGANHAPLGPVPDLSLFYFTGSAGGEEPYELLLDGARFADRHGFVAVWTPERHFHAFGGLYPNPAVTGAAVAAVTRKVEIRAGSVVLPLQDPLRIAEEWSVVDNLSHGRVGVSFASGWHAQDFVLAPDAYADRFERLYQGIATVQRLWRGEALTRRDGAGNDVDVRIHPRPIQAELPIWITSAGNAETIRSAGRMGANLLTHLLGQDLDQLAGKIALYREARAEAGLDPAAGCVSLMVHTYVGEDDASVRAAVREPLLAYLATSSGLVRNLAKSLGQDLGDSDDAMREFLEQRFDRYLENAGLMGTRETCRALLERFREIGVDDVACLIDFGIPTDEAMASLARLAEIAAPPSAPADTDDTSLARAIRRHGVTHLQCTPSMAEMLLHDDATREALGSLEGLLVGGEAFPATLAARLRDVVRGPILNMYGPTETTIWSTVHRLDDQPGPVPLGRPIANTRVYVMNEAGDPCPIGVPGELWIGGDGVTRGYLGRPELTAERFPPDSFADDHEARLYRTGDLVSWRASGELQFHGRLDHQVKVRGYRIELGEIEARLAEHQDVGEAIVLARRDRPGDQRLAAYVVARLPRPSVPALRAFLGERLPDYMIPSDFVFLDSLPLTPNKKIDRNALPAPAAIAREPETHVPARNDTERRLIAIWEEVLGRSPIGVEDDFFELGGQSLLAIQLMSRMRESMGLSLSLADLFRRPTVAAIAKETQETTITGAAADDLAAALDQLDGLSDDEVAALLAPRDTSPPA